MGTTLETARRVNRRIDRFMPLMAPLSVALGLLFPRTFAALRPGIPWIFGAITLSGSLNLRLRDLRQVAAHPLPVFLFFLLAHGAAPLAAFALSGLLFPGQSDTVSGYVLLFATPTAVSSLIWVSIYRGNQALSLSLIMLDSLAAPLVFPGTVALLLGAQVAFDTGGMIRSLLFMVVLPTILGVAVNEASRQKLPPRIVPYMQPFSKLGFVAVISANIAAAAPRIRLRDPALLLIVAFGVTFTALVFALAKGAGVLGRLPREARVSVLYACGMRNISAAATLAIDFFPPAAAVPAMVGILFQQILAAFAGKFLLKERTAGKN